MTMNDWRAELRLELENWSTPLSLPARANRMSTPPFLTRLDSFGSPTNETLIPPTTSASRSSKNRPTVGPPPTKVE